MKRKIWYQLELGKYYNLPVFWLNTPVVIKMKVKVWTYTAYWKSKSMEVKGWWGLLLPPGLHPHHSGPATRDFQISILVEALHWGCHLGLDFTPAPSKLPFTNITYGCSREEIVTRRCWWPAGMGLQDPDTHLHCFTSTLPLVLTIPCCCHISFLYMYMNFIHSKF